MADYTLKARLTADAKEFVSGLNRAKSELNGLQKFSINVGNKLKGFGDRIGSIGDSLTNKITKPAVAAGTAVAGITLAKGFQRLIGIDTARAKLVGLGHDAKGVELIMDSALKSVKGTAHGMDEAATTAANAVAAGVKEGEALTRYLTITGDAAAIAGASMSEMGSILNKVKTTNKAYNGELQQLSDRGLPIYQWLAKEAGVTAEKIVEMSSQGKISSEMLMNAIEKNIGGAAKKMGEESFTAGLANMWAAVGRLGASFLDAGGKGGGFFSTLKPLITDFTAKIDTMGDFAEKAGVKFGEMFTGFIEKVKEAKQWYDDLSPSMQNIINKTALYGSIGLVAIGPILKILSPLVNLLGSLGTTVIPNVITAFKLLTGPVGIVIGIITALVALFLYLYNTNDQFREKVHEVWSSVQEKIGIAVEAVRSFVMDIFGQVVDFWKENNQQIKEAASKVWTFIQKTVEKVMAIVEFVVKDVWGSIKNIIQGQVDKILGLVKIFSSLFTGDWQGVWDGAKQFLGGAVKQLFAIFDLLLIGKILKGVKGFGTVFKNTFTSIWNAIKSLFTSSVNSISSGFTTGMNFIKSNATRIFNAVKDAMLKPVNAAKDAIGKALDAIKGFFSGLKLKFPKITMPKLPKFSLKGKFSLMPPSVPKIGVNWNAKGGIFSRPTIFNTANAGMQGVGEAGPEAILPLNSKVLGGIGKGIERATDWNSNQDVSMNTGRIENLLEQINNRGFIFNVNGQKLAELTKDDFDRENGRTIGMTERWELS